MSAEMAAPTVTRHIAAVVLGYLNEQGGYEPSTGEASLIAAAFSLDRDTARECLSTPGLLAAVDAYRAGGAVAVELASLSGDPA